ncbi:4-phosphopantetheinyl transferase [Duganella radicis]|uniref:4-phosphopantetheinyl transferase n=1 Tax=Duganella radicis TaxID=551988 RepID=UPI00147882D8|nr:4-phosphopantetheinyl transferase [Duganella radicis]
MKPLAVHLWPGPTPAPQDGLFAILIRTAPSPALREAARRGIRLAAREALAAVLRIPVADIAIASTPGAPPRILLAGAPSRIGISISHETGHSLAAINLRGPIGADLMYVQAIPDWPAIARDYLGPKAAGLKTPAEYTQAWTQREAALKCHAQQISEWQADLPGEAIPLVLPVAELVGHIHIGDRSA